MTKILYAKDYVEKKSGDLIERVKNLKSKPIILQKMPAKMKSLMQ